jgi:four helix bundle protein
MKKFERFEDSEAWKKGMELVKRIYEISDRGELRNDYALRDQVRRAAISIPSNIAEGCDRGGNAEFVRFLTVAKGSGGELKTHLYIMRDLGYVTEAEFASLYGLCGDVVNLVGGLIRFLKRSGLRGPRYKGAREGVA